MIGRCLLLGVFGIALLAATPAAASRCSSGITDGVHCQCPDFKALLADPNSLLKCRAGETAVIYDLGFPFAPDHSTSQLIMRASVGAPCAGLQKSVAFHGQLVGCWSPLRDGCRRFSVPTNGICLDIDAEPLGPPCAGDCASLTTGQLAIATAGSAAINICVPKAPATSCRGTSARGEDIFQFQPGGLCDSYGCVQGQPAADSCVRDWGATYLGFQRPPQNVPGWYDWPSGGFKVTMKQRRQTCGSWQSCLGRQADVWSMVLVANPALGYKPPCLSTDPRAACNPPGCTP